MARIAINGFGRIGRLFFRQAFPQFDIVAVNDLSDAENLAYLLRHDTVYWGYNKTVSIITEGGKKYLVVADSAAGTAEHAKKIVLVQEKDPSALPWKELGIDIVVECTGLFESFEKARAHITAGAKRVVVSAPAEDAETDDAKTVLLGVNDDQLKTCLLSSNGSCTTNAAHPVMAIMMETVGVKKALLTTVHGYTATQSLVDGEARGKDFRRGRAGALNIIPSATGAAVSVSRALPALHGIFDAMALRVPVVTGSLASISFMTNRATSVEEINGIFKNAAVNPRWSGVVAVSSEPLVSSDVIGMPYGAIIDLSCTKVVDHDLAQVVSWYDNEWGYAAMLVGHVRKIIDILT